MLSSLTELGATLDALTGDPDFEKRFSSLCEDVRACVKGGHTLVIMGNGGSAGEAQHFAGEIVGRFMKERPGMPAIALTTDTTILTAIGNDYGFEYIFARQLEALGKTGDVAFLLSTSGNSENLMRAVETAKKKGMRTLALLGKGGGTLAPLVDSALVVPSDSTPRIQEIHLNLIHAICAFVDAD
jgi:D-sedoheptulose 7-phosphate isomerase